MLKVINNYNLQITRINSPSTQDKGNNNNNNNNNNIDLYSTVRL